MTKKSRVYFLTEEELERFDQMLTALGQAYWALVHQRSAEIVFKDYPKGKITKAEEDFYQLHFELNSQIETEDSLSSEN